MKALQLSEPEKLELTEMEPPEPGPDEVLIEVKACGICGTDVHIYHGSPGSAEVHPPIVLGHELSGKVVQTGSEVQHVNPEDRLSVDPNIYCGICKYCRDGRKHLCDHMQAVGVTRNGGMAYYCAVPAENCYSLPESLSYDEGALIEPLGCVLHGASQLRLTAEHEAVVIGGGFIGQLMVQVLKTNGLKKITVVEPVQAKHEFLRELGAETIVTPDQSVSRADVVVECVGARETMQMAVKIADKGGQILLFGVASPDMTIEMSPYEVFSKELTIRGSFINPDTHQKAIRLVESGQVNVSTLISHRFNMEEMPEVMRDYRQLKVNKGLIG